MTARTQILSTPLLALMVCALPQMAPADSSSPPRESAVAVVNGEALYTEDLERVLGTLHAGANVTDRSNYDLDRLLFRLVNDTLLSQEARSLGLQNEEPIPSKLELQRTGLAVQHLEQKEIWKQVQVTEEEIQSEFEKGYRSASFHVLTTREKEEAQTALKDLEKGEDFEAVARRMSIDQYQVRGGEVKDVHFIDLPAAIGDDLFALRPGQLGGPILSDLGWTVVRADSFEEADPAKFAIVKRFLDRVLRERRAEEVRGELAQQLRQKHLIVVNEKTTEAIGWERLPTSRIVAKIDDPEARVATIGAQIISAKIYGNALNAEWKEIRNLDKALSRRPEVLDQLVREALFREEAKARGYYQLPSVERQVKAKERELLVPKYLSSVLAPTVVVAPEDLQALYAENRDLFRPPPQFNLGQISTPSREQAEKVAELMQQGADLAWLASQYSIDEYKEASGERGWMTPTAGDEGIHDAILESAAGDVLGPYDHAGEFVVILIKEREEQDPRPFEDVESRVRSMVFAKKFGSVVDQHIQELRAASEIVLHREVMEALAITAEPGQRDPDSADSAPGHGGGHGASQQEPRP